jgi:hypothetical protein
VRDEQFSWAAYECAGEENEQGCDSEPQGCKLSRHSDSIRLSLGRALREKSWQAAIRVSQT